MISNSYDAVHVRQVSRFSSTNGPGACARVLGRGEWSVRALRRIDPQPRLQRVVTLDGVAASRETRRNGNLRGLSMPN